MTIPTSQQAFDIVARHLRAQGRRSMLNKKDCAYHSKDGCKCGVGIFIPDNLYHPSMEGKYVDVLADYFPDVSSYLPENRGLLSHLQRTHDEKYLWEAEPHPGRLADAMKVRLRDIAAAFGLSSSLLEEA